MTASPGPDDPMAQTAASPCQSCGACCSYDAAWPRFSLESEEQLALIPDALMADDLSGMRAIGNRCAALVGTVGDRTACSIYSARPDVCRACQPGDDACRMARAGHGLPELPHG